MTTRRPQTKIAAQGDILPRFVIGGVGTGGHYFPAVVVAQELQGRRCDVLFLVRSGQLEEAVAHRYGIKTFPIVSRPFFGKSVVAKIRFVTSLVCSVLRLNRVTKDCIGIAFGGFGAVPLALSCMINRSAFYIFEANRVAGRATKLFASRAKRVFLGLPLTNRLQGNMTITGIPVRQEFRRGARPKQPKRARAPVILFYGGSQGARRLNDLALGLQETMPGRWHLIVITGMSDYKRVVPRKGTNTRVLPFVEAPWLEMIKADVIVSRAGALAGYEILNMNKKVLFIPFPYALDNHQYHNAMYFCQIGNAVVHDEQDLNADTLCMLVKGLLKSRPRKRAETIRDAEKRIADCLVRDVRHAKT